MDVSKFSLKGKAAIVIGGAGDIGKAIAETFSEAGADVVISSRKQENLDKAAEEIKAQLREEPARMVFQFDCTSRGKAFLRDQQKLQLLEALRGRIGLDIPWLGFYTFGEIAPVGERNYFHNYTVVLMAIYQ